MQLRMLRMFFLAFAFPILWVDAAPLAEGSKFLPETVDFSDFTVEISAHAFRRVDFNSHPGAIGFKHRFNFLEGRRANFAGHYLLLYWGCGTGCQQFAIVDVKTGQVFMNEGWSTSLGVCYRADSALLITNPGASESMRVDSGYYQWDGEQLNLLGRGVTPQLEDCNAATHASP
ncbi:hypothetical protein BKP64_08975 [Marinobacter salinus]|uniref:Uncharacterized protein n=1 Tax=Marinobacter salinus TaxID=1874317 RepID=A0A1D9GLA6_9GAMM|nr:hypothetical protein [Marinobacter salinus]AOY88285.1 hypothetical protein BKP64_08975 [Marinobacter salinus]